LFRRRAQVELAQWRGQSGVTGRYVRHLRRRRRQGFR
jgi:hypothetical protein